MADERLEIYESVKEAAELFRENLERLYNEVAPKKFTAIPRQEFKLTIEFICAFRHDYDEFKQELLEIADEFEYIYKVLPGKLNTMDIEELYDYHNEFAKKVLSLNEKVQAYFKGEAC